ncbi:hypothetical protein AB0H37_38130 [Actinomadura sp. NPDC023710]|uniref:hypothetical protein n=1 Tax=Actinomadura sp. NPDC023710 TaxID=3158219 RepID=UPI0033CE26B3
MSANSDLPDGFLRSFPFWQLVHEKMRRMPPERTSPLPAYVVGEERLREVRERLTRQARRCAFEECVDLGADWAEHDFPSPRPGLHDPGYQQRDARYRTARDLVFQHAEPLILAHDWDPCRYDHPAMRQETRSTLRKAATAAGMPAQTFGAVAAYRASPAAKPAPHRDVAEQVQQMIQVLDGLTAAEQRIVLDEAARTVRCDRFA